MHSIRHFYYQNKEKIWKVILVVVVVLGIIYFLNSTVIEQNNSHNKYSSYEKQYHYNEAEDTYIQGTGAISGENITEKEAEKINNTVSKFLQYCKNKNIQEAYEMLSEECKQERYGTLEQFSELYVNKKFGNNQTYTVQKWQADTYKVDFQEDPLTTGNVSNGVVQVEYITITEENELQKLNINGFVGKKSINKEETLDSIKIKVLEKYCYMDYEEYKIEIQNLSNKTIKLDSFENTGTIYLKDNKGNKYNARMHEMVEEETVINPKLTVKLSIKFTNAYSSNRKISSITFENIVLDYLKYKKHDTSTEFEEICEFKINL